MDDLKVIFKVVAEGLRALAKEIDKMGKAVGKLETGAKVRETRRRATKAKPGRKPAVKKPRKGTATDAVYTVIEKSKKGVNTTTIKKKTGFDDKKIWNIINRLKKEGKIKNVSRGVYGKA